MKHLFIQILFNILAYSCSRIYGANGLNLLFSIAPCGVIIQLLNRHGANVDPTARILSPLIIHGAKNEKSRYFKNLTIEGNVFLGRDSFIDLTNKVSIGKDACISHGLKVMTHTDGADSWAAKSGILQSTSSAVMIGKEVYIGAFVTILEGVSIGQKSIIGARSLINRNVQKESLNYGVPCKSIRKLK